LTGVDLDGVGGAHGMDGGSVGREPNVSEGR